MKPSIGRIVLYRDKGSSDVAAIVTRVFDDDKVRLTLFKESGAVLTVLARHDEADPPLPETWRWPPRV